MSGLYWCWIQNKEAFVPLDLVLWIFKQPRLQKSSMSVELIARIQTFISYYIWFPREGTSWMTMLIYKLIVRLIRETEIWEASEICLLQRPLLFGGSLITGKADDHDLFTVYPLLSLLWFLVLEKEGASGTRASILSLFQEVRKNGVLGLLWDVIISARITIDKLLVKG